MDPFIVTVVLLLSRATMPVQTEAQAIKHLESLGGTVLRDRKIPGEPVIGVVLVPSAARDADLKLLTRWLRRVRKVEIHLALISGAAVKSLSQLEELEDLQLHGTGTEADEAALQHLPSLKRLRSLSLSGVYVSDEGAKHLAKLTQLRVLNLSGNEKLTDIGLRHLASLQELRELYLSRCYRVEGEGLQYLGTLKQLQILSMAETSITNDALRHLRDLKALRKLDLYGTRVGDIEAIRLQQALSRCTITNSAGEDLARPRTPSD